MQVSDGNSRPMRLEVLDGLKRVSAAKQIREWTTLNFRVLDVDERLAKAAIKGGKSLLNPFDRSCVMHVPTVNETDDQGKPNLLSSFFFDSSLDLGEKYLSRRPVASRSTGALKRGSENASTVRSELT